MSDRSVPRKSRELERFDLYLRRGLILREEESELKFNPYHDPDDGRFTFAPGGGTLPPRSGGANMGRGAAGSRATPAAKPKTSPQPSQRRIEQPAQASRRRGLEPVRRIPADHGALSAKYESGGSGDPGAVSSGANDPGGVSYGKHQYASKTGTAAGFIASPEARKWARDFQGLVPGTSQFSAKWREVAAGEGTAFGIAQDTFTKRTHYDETVSRVMRATGLDLDGGSEALRQVTFSVTVQHGRAATILRDAIDRTDGRLKRTDRGYQAALINGIYDRRVEYVSNLRTQAKTERRLEDARGFDNILKNRYPRERVDALRLLSGQ